jgi:hypothetical protein
VYTYIKGRAGGGVNLLDRRHLQTISYANSTVE